MGSQQAEWVEHVETALAHVQTARTLDADWPPNSLETADEALQTALGGEPPGPLPVPPAPSLVLPLWPGAIYGRQKWLPGSLGCDLFGPRGAPVFAPMDCIVRWIVGGTGLSGGAEMILSLPDRSWAWRYRHVQAVSGMKVGLAVQAGQTVAQIMDVSLDQLGLIPAAWQSLHFPDGWQHLDLSVNKGSDQFAPTGGGGGNYDADQWMQEHGYQGNLISRTPGPPDAGRGMAESMIFMAPADYHPLLMARYEG